VTARRALLATAFIAALLGAGSCKGGPLSEAEGRELFRTACARCHGSEGKGGLPLWATGPAPIDFGRPAFQSSVTDEQIARAIARGKGTAMPAFGSRFDELELAALVAQVRRFGQEKPR